MGLKAWEIWDAEERELKVLREVVEILEREDDGDFASAKLEEGIERVYEKMSELKHEIWEKRKKYEEDGDLVALEKIDENIKRILEEGIRILEGAAALIICQLWKIVIERELNKRSTT